MKVTRIPEANHTIVITLSSRERLILQYFFKHHWMYSTDAIWRKIFKGWSSPKDAGNVCQILLNQLREIFDDEK